MNKMDILKELKKILKKRNKPVKKVGPTPYTYQYADEEPNPLRGHFGDKYPQFIDSPEKKENECE